MEVVSQYRHLVAYLLLTFETAFHCCKFSDFSTRSNSFSVPQQADINQHSKLANGNVECEKKNCNTKQASYHLDIFETVCFGDKVTCVYIRGFMHYDIIYENNQQDATV
jgi:hypothetical protein